MASRHRAALFCAVLVFAVGCDHGVKHAATRALEGAGPVSFLGDAVRFELVHNPGAFLSLGAGWPEAARTGIFVLGAPLLLAVACAAALHAGLASAGAIGGLALLVGGGLGNWLDRLANDGAVTDFVSLGAFGVRTGVFNVADVLIGAGALLLLTGRPRPRVEAAPPAGEPPAA